MRDYDDSYLNMTLLRWIARQSVSNYVIAQLKMSAKERATE